ncbi:hypothetical protein IWQ62_003914 [Dispira parvispora]|uniref:Tetratricopeptide repeat protein 39B n=1 Tax=Dispira parvispora TaxID=1520584 RepID=A0A9W8ATY0_9FUNG|nr:hypothetical protein IWQ62_003914 [Dispira parvispora]
MTMYPDRNGARAAPPLPSRPHLSGNSTASSTMSGNESEDDDNFEDAKEFLGPTVPGTPEGDSIARQEVLVKDLATFHLHPFPPGSPEESPSPPLPRGATTGIVHTLANAGTPGTPSTDVPSPASPSGSKLKLRGLLRRPGGKDNHKPTQPRRSLTSPIPSALSSSLDSEISVTYKILDQFLDSQMQEAEDQANKLRDSSLYASLGYSLILFLKATMTFEGDNIIAAQAALKHTLDKASRIRKDSKKLTNAKETGGGGASFVSGLGAGVMDTLGGFLGKGGNSWQAMKTMNRTQLHAELVYAETSLLKAMLNIYSEDGLLNFLKEGLHVRSSYVIYRDCSKFLAWINEPENRHLQLQMIDCHFVSGVVLGVAMFNMILSLLPDKYLRIVEIFGFSGDRTYALELLEVGSGWREPDSGPDARVPAVYRCRQGLRRPFSDMALLFYHTVFSSIFPLSGVSVGLAQRILLHHLRRHKNGVIFMYFAARTHQILGQIPQAIAEYHRTIAVQKEWAQLQHLCYWELVINHFSLLQFTPQATDFLDILLRESRWSKAVYTYCQAASLYQGGATRKDIRETMDQVGARVQRIGGKSIPVEKFVARKARKFFMQNQRLLLPALELMMVWSAFMSMPVTHLWLALALVDKELETLDQNHDQLTNDEHYYYYDDLCLAHLLRGIILRELAYPTSAVLSSTSPFNRPAKCQKAAHAHGCTTEFDCPLYTEDVLKPALSAEAAVTIREVRAKYNNVPLDQASTHSFHKVVQHSHRIALDHYLFFMAHYQLGLLYLAIRDLTRAIVTFEVVIRCSGSHSFDFPTRSSSCIDTLPKLLLKTTKESLDQSPSVSFGEESDADSSGTPTPGQMRSSTPVPQLGNQGCAIEPLLSSFSLTKRRAKYSMQNIITLKSYNALQKAKSLQKEG